MKPRTSFLLPVWGGRHLRYLASISLPTLAAPGNLPALAAATDLEMVLLTTAEGYAFLQHQPAFRRIAALMPVRHLPIDDLVAGALHYALPLTYAYWRGVADAGADMVNRHFVFMNADFVVADGGLAELAKLIVAGHPVVLSSNLRAVEEQVSWPLIRRMNWEEGYLSIPPRDLMRLVLRHQHALQTAKQVNMTWFHSSAVNQFFWRADPDTLISHHYLLFMLALKPQRVVTDIQGFCDYNFVPELCPDTPSVAFEDSDRFAVIELQKGDQESHYLRPGRPTADGTAAILSAWTNAYHRVCAAQHQIIFHAGPLPPETAAVSRAAQSFIDDLNARLGPPQPLADHPYWRSALQSARIEPPVPLVAAAGAGAHGPLTLPSWHPEWLDYRPLAAVIGDWRRQRGAGEGVLLLAPEGQPVPYAPALAAAAPGLAVTASTRVVYLKGLDLPGLPETLGLVVVHLHRDDFGNVGLLADLLLPRLPDGGRLVLFFHDPVFFRMAVAVAFAMREVIGHGRAIACHPTDMAMAGGSGRKWLLMGLAWLRDLARRRPIAGRLIGGLGWPPLAAAAWLVNRRGRRTQDDRTGQRDCSSFTLVVRKQAPPAVSG